MLKYFYRFLLLILISSAENCIGQFINDPLFNDVYENKFNGKWTFDKFKDSTDAKLLLRIPVSYLCGDIAWGAVSIAVLEGSDTVRLITLCDMDTSFVLNETYDIIPENAPGFGVTLTHPLTQLKKDKQNNETSYILLSSIRFRTYYGRLSHRTNKE